MLASAHEQSAQEGRDVRRLCAVPDNFVAEILGGELYASPRAGFAEARCSSSSWVRSAGATRAIDRRKKLPIYAREDVGHAWLVDRSNARSKCYG
jgi:hypothetical protein